MATPLFDVLHLRFARRMRDPVATAATAGNVFTVANRSDYLNRAYTKLQQEFLQMLGRDGVRERLQTQVGSQALTFAGAGIAVASDYNNVPLAVVKTSSTNLYRYHPRQEEITANVNPNHPYAFTVVGNTLYVYESGVLIPATASGTFYYLKKDEVTQGGSTDILLPAAYYDLLVDIAVNLAAQEDKRPVQWQL